MNVAVSLPHPLSVLIRGFAQTMLEEGRLAFGTIEAYVTDLHKLEGRLGLRGVSLQKATSRDIVNDIAEREEGGVKPTSIARELTSARAFYRYLLSRKACEEDPTLPIGRPRITRDKKPKVMTREDFDRILAAPDMSDPLGYRNRLMIELACAVRIRTSLLVGLTMNDVDLDSGHIFVTRKDGAVDKVSLAPVAKRMLREYLEIHRPRIVLDHEDCIHLFPTYRSHYMTRQALWHIIQNSAQQAGVSMEHVRSHDLRRAYLYYNK